MTALKMPERTQGGMLGLDLATRTGWTYAVPGELPVGDTLKLPSLQDVHGAQPAALRDGLVQIIERYRPCAMAAEASIMIKGKQQTGAMKSGFGLNTVAAMLAFDYGLDFLPYEPQEARGIVLTDRTPPDPKNVVMRFCQERGWTFYDHNEADAHIVREAGMIMRWKKGALCPKGPFLGHRFWRKGTLL